MINTKSKIAIFVLIIGIIIISGWWIWNNFETKEKDITIVTPIIESENYIAISHSEKDGESILLFDVNLQDYSVKSVDLSKLSEEDLLKYKKLGSEFIVPPKFDYTSGFSLLEIKTGNDSLECKPIIPYLEIEITLPSDSEARGELLGFIENKMEEKIEIAPLITCNSYGCSDCSAYTEENDFFPNDILIRTDVRSLQEETLVRAYLPLLRYNPAIRETYIVKEAKIKIAYKLNKDNMLLLEEENMPNKVDTAKFSVSYKVINPSATELNNLKIKIDLDDGAVVNFSEEFNIRGHESKIVSFQIDSLWYQGSFISNSYLLKDSRVIATMPRKWIQFSAEIARPEMCKTSSAVHLTYQNIEKEISSGWWLVYFCEESNYCCKSAPIIDDFVSEISKINFGEINSFEYYKKYNVYGVPTFILFKDGQEIDRKVGVYSKEDLKIWLESQVK